MSALTCGPVAPMSIADALDANWESVDWSMRAIREINAALAAMESRSKNHAIFMREELAWPLSLLKTELIGRQEVLSDRCDAWFDVAIERHDDQPDDKGLTNWPASVNLDVGARLYREGA